MRLSRLRRSLSAREKPRLGRKGKGCAGSMAIGVSTAKSWLRNSGSSRSRSVLVMRARSTISMPAAAISLRRTRHWRCCSAIRPPAAALTCSSCSAGVRPSGETTRTRSRTWPFRPATRVMKNSSRLLAEMDRKRTRSSSGWLSFAASSSTRPLKASHDSSRLMKRSGEAISASDSSSCGAREEGTSSPVVSTAIGAISVMTPLSRGPVTAATAIVSRWGEFGTPRIIPLIPADAGLQCFGCKLARGLASRLLAVRLRLLPSAGMSGG
ncbi:hypothetical protein D3C73_834620 [compost metagenome]